MGLVERLVGRGRDRGTRVGIFVDGPNVFRPEFDVDLDELRDIARDEGTVSVARVYVDANAGSGLIQAAEARGFEVVTTSGDVDVKLAIEAVEAAVDEQIDTVIVVSRDTDFKPVLEIAAKRGLRTIAVAPGTHGRSDALRNVAHHEITLE
ncbi:MAG: NYN domain-containing protein [Natronomonas sp.]|uniref:NYN domain-containing protein n=1 Tax=Natronomonas sp. TaxID=2184060 RepID=UPI00287026F9|nr:NYN domain-containing protein [Natronomonas sp.]MDR9380796.1 NYN domain-containing protein [Natronomonas sp.]MDR9429668.1 NYN domain-containing protein [Natronomonas sp.]